jgi:hypothetical protein
MITNQKLDYWIKIEKRKIKLSAAVRAFTSKIEKRPKICNCLACLTYLLIICKKKSVALVERVNILKMLEPKFTICMVRLFRLQISKF